MAQRRSKNRRLSAIRKSGNFSDFLNENSNIIGGNDLLWFNRTSVRPSTSLILTRNDSTFLNSDTTVDDASKVSDKWYNNLSKSDTSRRLETVVQDNIAQSNNESNKAEQDYSNFTESESDQELLQRRARFRLNRNNINKSEKSNVFLKALEKTTDSYTKNVTHAQTLEGNESESTNDDSKTIQRLRPKILRNNKQVNNNTNKFDNIFDSATEKIFNNIQSPRVSLSRLDIQQLSSLEVAEKFLPAQKSILKRRSNDDIQEKSTLVTIEKQQRTSEKIVNISQNEQSHEKSLIETNNSNNLKTKSSRKKSQTKSNDLNKQQSIDECINASNDSATNFSKKRSILFSQSHKSKNNNNMFDAVFDSDDTSSNASVAEKNLEKNLESAEKNDENDENGDNDDNVSESSSIPSNIRRTKSFSVFAHKRLSKGKSNDDAPNKSTTTSQRNVSSGETDGVAQYQENSSSDFDIYNVPKSQVITEEIDNDIYEKSVSPSKKSKLNNDNEKSPNQYSKRKLNQEVNLSKNSSFNKSKHKQTDITSPSQNSQNALNDSNNDENEESNSKISRTRSKLFTRKSQNNENVFDDISYEISKESEQSMTDTIKNSTRASQRRSSKESKQNSRRNLSNYNNKISTIESVNQEDEIEKEHNSQEDENDTDTSSMPKYIRRTMSRIFQKSKITDGLPDASIIQTSNLKTSQDKEQTVHNISVASSRSSRTSNVILRDVNNQNSSNLFKTPKVSLKNISNSNANKSLNKESQKENQESIRKNNQSQKYTTNNANVSLNKTSFIDMSTENERNQVGDDKSTGKQTPNNRSITNIEPVNLIEKSPERRKSRVTFRSRNSDAGTTSDFNLDDLLTTPHPAQSTLNPYGKPLTRLTQFSFRNSITPESPIQANIAASPLKKVAENAIQANGAASQLKKVVQNEERKEAKSLAVEDKVAKYTQPEDENMEVDVINNSDSEDYDSLLITRRAEDIPHKSFDEVPQVENTSKAKTTDSTAVKGPSASTIDEKVWAIFRKKTDALKENLEACARRAVRQEHERAQQKARIDAQLRRRIAQQEAEKRRLKRKPVDKAFHVNGQVYKQPKLPRPKKWVTPRLYTHLYKCLEPKFGLETRIRSEKFVKKLTDIFNVVVKRKKYDNYKAELDDLMQTMAELNIIQTRYDFYRFCSEFMPSNFKDKAVPMQMPGNVRNIPYNSELVFKPILAGRTRRRVLESNSEGSESD